MNKYANKLMPVENNPVLINKLSPINQALSKLMKLHDLDDRGLAKIIGQAHANIARMRIDPKVNPTLSTMQPIANFFGITIDQLIHNNLDSVELEFKSKQVPLINLSHIDFWIENKYSAIENAYVTYDGDINPKSIFCFKLPTNEYEPFIKKNAKVFVDSEQEIKNNSLILIKLDKSITICKVLKTPNGYFIRNLKDISKTQIKLLSTHKTYGVIIEIVFL